MRLMFIVALLALLQAPTPVPRKAVEDTGQITQDQKDNTPSNKADTTKPEAINNSLGTVPSQQKSPSATTTNEERPQAVRVVGEVSVEKDLADYIYIGASLMLTLATLVIAGIALMQAKAAKASVTALIDSERAWVLVEIGPLPNFQPDPNNTQILWISPTVKNHGKTPARIKKIVAVLRLVPDGQKLPPIPEYPIGQGANLVIDVVVPPGIWIQPIALPVSGQEFIRVTQQQVFLYLHGFIEYLDLGGTKRRSGFCFFYSIQTGFSPSPSGFYLELTAPPAYTECT